MAGTGEVELFRPDGKRLDGRDIEELRPVKMQVGVLPQADGSAYIEHGNNKIMVAVYGPREMHPKHLTLPDRMRIRAEYRLATFSVGERKSPAPRRREVELSKMITESLEPSVFLERFPRSVVDIYINVLDADGGTRAASITAASLALADAGMPLRGLVSAVAAGKVGDKVVLDLSDSEDKYGLGDLPVAIVNQNQAITLLQADGHFTPDELKEALDMAIRGCGQLHEMQRAALLDRYHRPDLVSDEEEPDVEEVSEEELEAIEEVDEEDNDDDDLDVDVDVSDDDNDDNGEY